MSSAYQGWYMSILKLTLQMWRYPMQTTVPSVLLGLILYCVPLQASNEHQLQCWDAYKTEVYGMDGLSTPIHVGMHCLKPDGTYYFTNRRTTKDEKTI